ncbi:MAG TPA: cysteine--tRNA ligase [Coriobacteriia bacterium]
MTLRVYNTMARAKQEFVPREAGRISIYTCGPTVYNHIHIGNARTFLSFDVIRRYLEYRGFDVKFVQNVTDVDDKIINRANEEGRPASEVAADYTEAFVSAMRALGVKDPTVRPKATETIPQMIALIERLIAGDHAYDAGGDVYFAVRSFPGYGKLSGRDVEEMENQARIETDPRKRDPLDFALWKAAKPGEPHWSSPWGEGRPGWHIECSAMSEMEFGLPFDIHGGGSDLIFPHHENEIAQSEAATGVTFANYWLHGGMLQVDSEKMSKSLGNFLLLKDVLATYPVPVIRLLMLQTHYRSSLDYSTDRLDEAATACERISNMVRTVRWAQGRPAAGGGAPEAEREALSSAIATARERFVSEMDDDFNTAGALGAVFDLVRQGNVFLSAHDTAPSADDLGVLGAATDAVTELIGVLGVTLDTAGAGPALPQGVVALAAGLAGYQGSDPAEAADALLALRASARAERDWARADAVRDGLSTLGVSIADTATGARVTVSGA